MASADRERGDTLPQSTSDAVNPPSTVRVETKPLVCGQCAGPVPLVDGDRATCPYCGAPVEIPPELRAMRAAQHRSQADHARLESAYRALGAPPGPLLRLWAGAAEGVLGLLWSGVAAFLGLWLSLVKGMGQVLEGIDDPHIVVAVLALPLLPVAALVYAIEQGFRALAPSLHVDLIAPLGPGVAYALVGAALCLLIALPVAVFHFATAFVEVRLRLQAGMAARPPARPGGPALCRLCGAALRVAPGELGVRCDYCHGDNLVALPPAWVAAAKQTEATQHLQIGEALAEERSVRQRARGRLLRNGVISLLAVAAFGGAGGLASSTGFIAAVPGWNEAVVGDHSIEPAVWPVWRGGRLTQGSLPHILAVPPFDHGVCGRKFCLLDYEVALRDGETLVLQTDADAPEDRVRLRVDPAPTWQPGSKLATLRFTAPFSGWFPLRLSCPLHASYQVAWHVEPRR